MNRQSPAFLKKAVEILLCAQILFFLLLIIVNLSVALRYAALDRPELFGGVLLGSALWMVALGAIYLSFRRVPHKAASLLLLCALLSLQAVYVYGVCGTLNSDASTVVKTAYDLAMGNELSLYSQRYFSWCPENIPAMRALAALFKLWRPAELEQSYFPLALLTAALSDVAVFFTYKTVELCRGKRAALAALLFSVALISVAEPSTVFYTDIWALWTLPAAAYIYVYLHTPRARAFTNRRRVVLWCLMGGILAFGVWVKPQIAVGVIAGVIVLALSKLYAFGRKGSGVRYAALSFAGCALILSLIGHVVIFGTDHIQDIELNKTPPAHLIAMGLNKDSTGFWNADDANETHGIQGQAQKNEFLREKIARRLQDFGPGGLLIHLHEKLLWTARAGVLDNRAIWRGEPVHHGPVATAVQEYTLRGHDGAAEFFEPAVQSCYILVFALALLGPWMAYARKEDFAQPGAKLAQAARLSWIGIILFLFLFESNNWYLFAMRPALIFLAACALDDVFGKVAALWTKGRKAAKAWPETSLRLKSYRDIHTCKAALRRRTSGRRYTILCLSALGLAVGMLGLRVNAYSGLTLSGASVWRSYLFSPFLLLMNLLPPFLLIWLGYFLFRRAWAAYLLSALPTLGLALVNYYKIKLRGDPLYPGDLTLVRTVGGVVGQYGLPVTGTIILAVLLFVLGLLWSVFLCVRKGPKGIRQRVVGVILCALMVWGSCGLYTNSDLFSYSRLGTASFSDQGQYYVARGGWYPFIYYTQNLFKTEPEGYNAAAAAEAYSKYTSADIPQDKKVHIVGVMLEAFSDLTDYPAVASLPGVEQVYQPLHELESRSISGHLLVDVFGGGTCITEWASLTGSNAYNSYLTDIRSPEDSYVWYLREQGYQTTFTHPYYSYMYNRKNVLPWLGFEKTRFQEDSFQTLVQYEGMVRSDGLLFDLLRADMAANEAQGNSAPMFSFAVSLQNHGSYSSVALENGEVFSEAESGLSHESWTILNNYLDGVRDTIGQITRFTDDLEGKDEPYVVYFFGDHKPWLGNSNSVYNELGVDLDIATMDGYYNHYSTPYLIWANSAAKEALGKDFCGEGRDISPCFLMAELFDACGWEGPAFMKLAREMRDISPLISIWNIFLDDGKLTTTLSGEKGAFYERYRQLQYYRKLHGLKG